MDLRPIPLLLLALVLALLIGAGLGYLVGYNQAEDRTPITSFDECRAAGYPVMESYPERCATPDGRTFTRDITSDDMPSGTEPVFCTMDAKVCPDGSFVGRVGPNCEFAPCP